MNNLNTTKYRKRNISYCGLLALLIILASCTKFLDKKTDKTLVVPATLEDARALLDNYAQLNSFYPMIGELSGDDYFLADAYFNTMPTKSQENHIWAVDTYNDNEWTYMYHIIMVSNVALETLNKLSPTQAQYTDWAVAKGGALFFRAYALYQTVQYYAAPYDKATASDIPGVPVRLNSDINEKSTRPSLAATYDQIVADLKEAAALLPASVQPLSRPSRAAAYGALARTFLAIEDYVQAGKYADSALQLKSTLIDYNSLSATSQMPFMRFNEEVIFQSVMLGSGALDVNNWRVDSTLYRSYEEDDLRRTVFYRSNGSGTYGFKGNYDGVAGSSYFNGLAVDELYLIRAECRARAGQREKALADLNHLLAHRYRSGTFVPVQLESDEELLARILQERRKELVLRGLRWFDLRRLNKDERFARKLVRKLNGITYELPPQSPQYTFYIPQVVIEMSGIEQNKR